MAYPTLALHLLISAPSDVSIDDLASVRKTISQWNLNFGRTVGLTVLPVSWSEHAVAEFGERPQAIINHQLVKEADLAVALFCDRLGTPTGEAESGTAEEIEMLVKEQKSVAVLASVASRPPVRGEGLKERQRLESFLEELRKVALVFEYSNQGELIGHINNFLSRATGRFQQAVETSKAEERMDPDPYEGVWPRVEVRESVKTDVKGRIRTERHWSLVLANTSRGPASDVDFSFENLPANAGVRVIREDGPLGTIPPGQEARFPLMLMMNAPRAVDCLVTWTDATGQPRQTRATVRT